MYEHHHAPLLPLRQFLARVAGHFASGAALVFVSLGVGMWGYEHYENLAWRDAFLESAMLLGGMGPVHAPETPDGKLFAGFYALYAGLVFLVSVGIVFAPIVHRLMHRFHWQQDNA